MAKNKSKIPSKTKKSKYHFVVKQVGEEFYWDNVRSARFCRFEDAREYCELLSGIGVKTEVEMHNFKPVKVISGEQAVRMR